MSATTAESTTNGGPFVTRCREGYDKTTSSRPVKRYGFGADGW